MTAEDLKAILEALPIEQPVVEVVGQRPHLIATVTSGSFLGVDEADRQNRVWTHVRAERPAESVDVEFIFTNAPGEAA